MSQERLNGFAMCNIEKTILDTIDLNTVLMILHQETPEEVSFCEPMGTMECKCMVIKLILKLQINYCFSIKSFPIIKHVNVGRITQPSRVSCTRQQEDIFMEYSRISNK